MRGRDRRGRDWSRRPVPGTGGPRDPFPGDPSGPGTEIDLGPRDGTGQGPISRGPGTELFLVPNNFFSVIFKVKYFIFENAI